MIFFICMVDGKCQQFMLLLSVSAAYILFSSFVFSHSRHVGL